MKRERASDNFQPLPGTQVLVVGAGPTGLIVCHELLRRGIRCRLIEKHTAPSGSTRAFTLHARTMEMFDHLGLASRIDELREVCPGNRFHFRELSLSPEESPTLDFEKLPGTRYNYYGKVNQNDLDKALRDSLAANFDFHPEYGTEYIRGEPFDEYVNVTLRHTTGGDRIEEVQVPWLIGADGSRSAVRSTLGATFDQGEIKSMTMSMVDARLVDYRGDRNWVNYYVSAKGFMLVTGLPGGKFRIYLAGELEKLLEKGSPVEAFQEGLDFFDTGARIEAMDWSSTWEIRKIVGETYARGRVLLCGDATHVHSPAGGQGMNACMQDAFNVGWKLALVIQGRARDGILQTYADERRPIAEQVTEGADRMHQILFNASIPVAERFKLTQNPSWHSEAILRISGLSHNYRGVDGVTAGVELEESNPLPGDRAPDCVLSELPPRRRLYDLTRHPGFTLLYLCDDLSRARDCYLELAASLRGDHGHLVRSILVVPTWLEGVDPDSLQVDAGSRLRMTYGGEATQLILIRPDLYIGFRGSELAVPDLHDYLRKWVVPARTSCPAGA